MSEATLHDILPTEIFEKVLKKLGYRSLKTARGTCKQWRKVIDDFKLVRYASCKSTESVIYITKHSYL